MNEMRVKTFLVSLPELDIAFNQEKLENFQKKMDDLVGFEKSGIVLKHTPYNKVTSFTVVLWVIGRTEAENRKIMDKVESYLKEKNVVFRENESYLIWDEGKFFIEIEIRPNTL